MVHKGIGQCFLVDLVNMGDQIEKGVAGQIKGVKPSRSELWEVQLVLFM